MYIQYIVNMSKVLNINFQDTIISQWEEAIDKESAEKTLAFKYFNGNKEDLNNYLFPTESIASVNNSSCFVNYQQLELL